MDLAELRERAKKLVDEVAELEQIDIKTADDLAKVLKEDGCTHLVPVWSSIDGILQAQEIPAVHLDEEKLEKGFTIDGSSFPGWQGIENSDLVVMPDFKTAFVDPLRPNVIKVLTTVQTPEGEVYGKCPRGTLERAVRFLKESEIGDTVMFGPEPEFFMCDSIGFRTDPFNTSFEILDSASRANTGTRSLGASAANGAYMGTGVNDASFEIRELIEIVLNKVGSNIGLKITKGHTEVGGLQHELGLGVAEGVRAADYVQLYKYYVRRVAALMGKQVTFMPKFISGENGNGMHTHMSIMNGENNLFANGDDDKTRLSKIGMYAMAGVLGHANDMAAFSNPAANSYKRLIPGFEAPNALAYSYRNRSAGVRVPDFRSDPEARFEARWGDPLANPYLMFAAFTLAMVDGIKNKTTRAIEVDYDVFEHPERAQEDKVKYLVGSLPEALAALEGAKEFFTAGKVFTPQLVDSYIAQKRGELDWLRQKITAAEMELYSAR